MNPGAQDLCITLSRTPGTPWGFRLQGGADFTTPLSVQSVNPGSVAEQCGLQPGDAVLSINGRPSDEIEHELAKSYIVQSGDQVQLNVTRGAVKIWKPKVTPMAQLRPDQMNKVGGEPGEEQYVQRTSLAADKQEPLRIGSSHNRAPKPFPGFGGGAPAAAPAPAPAPAPYAPAPAPAPAPYGAAPPPAPAPSQQGSQQGVVHSQFNSPMQMYSNDNVQQTYNQTQSQLDTQMGGLTVSEPPAAASVSPSVPRSRSPAPAYLAPAPAPSAQTRSVSPTWKILQEEEQRKNNNNDIAVSERYKDHADGEEMQYKGYTDPHKQSRSFQMLNQQLEGDSSGAPSAPSSFAPAAPAAAPASGFRSVRAPQASDAPPPQAQQNLSTCTICGSLIVGVFVRIKGDPMHAECFKCTSCGMNLKQKGYFKVEGKLYCEQHARQVAQPPEPDMVIDGVVYR